MAWTAQLVGTRENPVPNDTMWITAEFTDGTRTFRKDYKLVAGGDVERLLRDQVAAVEDLYASVPGLTISVQAIPQVVTNFQCRAMLMAAGLFAGVDAALKAQEGVALAAWEYSATVHRQSPLVLGMAQSLGLTNAQIDAMFVQASQIAV